MTIETVKLSADGYIMNGTIFVPKAEGNSDYQKILLWIAEGKEVLPEFSDNELLVQEQTRLLALNKASRDAANNRPYKGNVAKEIVAGEITSNDVNFQFNTIATGQTLTEPLSILSTVLLAGAYMPDFYIAYSCWTVEIDEAPARKTVVQFTVDMAKTTMAHLAARADKNIKAANVLEALIKEATSLDDLEGMEAQINEAFSESPPL